MRFCRIPQPSLQWKYGHDFRGAQDWAVVVCDGAVVLCNYTTAEVQLLNATVAILDIRCHCSLRQIRCIPRSLFGKGAPHCVEPISASLLAFGCDDGDFLVFQMFMCLI